MPPITTFKYSGLLDGSWCHPNSDLPALDAAGDFLWRREQKELMHTKPVDAEPREVFIIACLLVPNYWHWSVS